MKNLHQLVYTSVRGTKCDEKEIQNIVDACKRNNPSRDVTGVLLYSDKRFIQYLEGDGDEIRDLYEFIKKDDRHSGVMERAFGPIKERRFPSWHMGHKDVDAELSYHTAISKKDQTIFADMIEGKSDYNDQAMRVLSLFFKMA
jgi:hypothetical protein